MNNQPKKLDKAMKISIIAGVLIAVLSITYYLVLFLPQKIKPLKEAEFKKQSLEKFFNDLTAVTKNHDWDVAYEFQPQSVHEVVTKEEYIEWAQNTSTEYVSEDTIIKEISIDGNKGKVHRVVTTCITQECEGDSKKIDDGSREFEYLNKNWQITDLDPSERALSAATNAYWIILKLDNGKKEFYKKYSFGKENLRFALKKYALELDKNLDKLIMVESIINMGKANKTNNDYNSINTQSDLTNTSDEQLFGTQSTESALDKFNQERKQECQQDLNKYNVCLSEYNSKMAEYNICLSESSDPSSWRHGSYCSKPFNFCYKPICAY